MRILLSANASLGSPATVVNGVAVHRTQMVNPLGKLRLPIPSGAVAKVVKGIIWALVVILGLFTLVLLGQRFNALRFVQPAPQQVRVTNISSNSFVVSWTTKQKTKGRVMYSTDSHFDKDVLAAYDAKDNQIVQNKAYQNYAGQHDVSNGTVQVNPAAFSQQEITYWQAGDYYTHVVIVENLQPETAYYFKVDNYLASWSAGQTGRVNDRGNELIPMTNDFSVVTQAVSDQLTVPNPSYGTVTNSSGQTVQDVLVYTVIEIPSPVDNGATKLYSEGLVSLVNNDGGYYFDFAQLRARSGEPMNINDDPSIKQYIVIKGKGETKISDTTLDKNAPVDPITISQSHPVQTWWGKYVLQASAQSNNNSSQDPATGNGGAYANLWNIQTVLHYGCIGGTNKLLGPQGCGAFNNSSYDVYVCQCGAFASDSKYQASAYAANVDTAKVALQSTDDVPAAAIKNPPCEPKDPIQIKDLKLDAKVQRINLDNKDFGVGIPSTVGLVEVTRDCKDASMGAGKTFKVDVDSQVFRDKLKALFNPQVYKGLCLWKQMAFDGEDGLASCKDDEGKSAYPVPTTSAGKKVSPYEYAKAVCGSDGGETAAELCGFGSLASDTDTGTGTPTPTPTGSPSCGDLYVNECKVSGGGATLGQCQANGGLKAIASSQSPYSCTNGAWSWDGSKWVQGTATPKSCRIDGVNISSNFCKVTGPNLYLCTNGNTTTAAVCTSTGARVVCGGVTYTCLSSHTWSTQGTTPLPTTSVAPTSTAPANPDGQQFASYQACQDKLKTVSSAQYDCSCRLGGGGGLYTLSCTEVTPTPTEIITSTPTYPPTQESQCHPGEYTNGWWFAGHSDDLYGCVTYQVMGTTSVYIWGDDSVAHCSTSTYYNKQYQNSGWYCNGSSWSQNASSAASTPTDTPPPTNTPTPTAAATPTGTGTPVPTSTPAPSSSTDYINELRDRYCSSYGNSGSFNVTYAGVTVECSCSDSQMSYDSSSGWPAYCAVPASSSSSSSSSRGGLIPAAQAQDTAKVIVSDKGYYIVPVSSGVYQITIPNKGTYQAILRSGVYNTLFIDTNKNGRYDPKTDELLPINIKEAEVKLTSVLQGFTLNPGFNFISLPYLFKDGFDKNSNSNYFYSRSSFLQTLNKDLPSGNEVTLLSRFANGSFDDTTVYRKDSQQTYNKDSGVVPGQGYAVRVLGDSRIFKELEFYQPTSSIPLDLGSGWNLVGVFSPNSGYTAASFAQLARSQTDSFRGQIDDITRWQNGRYDGIVFEGDKEFGFDFPLQPFQSYFVRVKGECDFNNCGTVKP